MSRFYLNGQVMECGLKEARKIGAVPSVTTVIKEGCPMGYGLRSWIDGQIAQAAVATTRFDGETTTDWLIRVQRQASQKKDTAADFGSKLHDAIQSELKVCANQRYSPPQYPDLMDWTNPFLQWIDEEVEKVMWTERVIQSTKLGFAGRADARFLMKDGRVGIPDFKTQGFKPGRGPNWYPEWAMQLAAYSHCDEFIPCEAKQIVCYSIVFDSNQPGMPKIRQWTEDEIQLGWEKFFAAFSLWKKFNNFYPESIDTISANTSQST